MSSIALVLLVAAHEPNPFLLQAKVFQQSLEFEKCLKRLENAARWKDTTDAERAEIELYQGLCRLGLGREGDAEQHFQRALRLDPAVALPPLTSPRVERLFDKARATTGIPAPLPIEEPAAPPPAPSLVPAAAPPTPPPEPVVEAQKPVRLGLPLGIAGLSAGALIAAAALGTQAQGLAAQSKGALFASDAFSLGRDAQTFALGANVLYAVAGAALVTAIIVFLVIN